MTDTIVLDASAAVRAVMDPEAQQVLLTRISEATTVISPALLPLCDEERIESQLFGAG
jgi:predicted nucleic acid-binding protein